MRIPFKKGLSQPNCVSALLVTRLGSFGDHFRAGHESERGHGVLTVAAVHPDAAIEGELPKGNRVVIDPLRAFIHQGALADIISDTLLGTELNILIEERFAALGRHGWLADHRCRAPIADADRGPGVRASRRWDRTCATPGLSTGASERSPSRRPPAHSARGWRGRCRRRSVADLSARAPSSTQSTSCRS
jgi:hypothetical protein